MKKNLQILMIVLAACSASFLAAQSTFKFQQTNYVGALSGDPAKDWTKGWTNWDPKTTTYPAPTDTSTLNGMVASLPIRGEKVITNTVTLSADQTYLLKGFVVVKSGGKLVIPAGTVIRCLADLNSSPKNYATIVVERGGQIEVTGTLAKPVVFTSAKDAGARDRGDWGGIVVCGRGLHNLFTTPNSYQIEGFNGVTFDNQLAFIGGNDNNDNSGILRYLRLEFGGLAFEINREINGLTFGAVGAATEVNNIQISYSNDDSFEWFGGAVNSKNLIAYKGTDDDFDTDNGYSGLNQFGIAVRDTAYFDATYNATSGSSTSEGFESDNEALGTANVKPITSAVFSNYTMVGPIPVGATYSQMNSRTRAAFRRGARIRRNSALRIVNSIFMGYRNFLMIDGDSTVRNTNFPAALALVNPKTPVDQKTHQTFFTNNLIVNTSAAQAPADSTSNSLLEVARARGSAAKLAALNDWARQAGPLANKINPVAFSTGTLLVNPLAASTTPDFNPVDGSPALTGANFLDNPILSPLTLVAPSTPSTFKMEKTSYVGALSADPAKDWTNDWTNWNPKATAYPNPTDTTTLNGMVATLPIRGEKVITNTVTLSADQTYLLKGFVVVKSGGKLVIPAGTVIRALADLNSSPKNYATIVVERGGQIEITGTVAKPVVFTSAKAAGARDRGDWGGIVVCGKGLHNLFTTPNSYQIEGFNGVTFDNQLAFIGGNDNNDNSGILRYLRLEFGGLAFEINREINGLTFGAVGAATEVNNIQVSFSNDDSFEWFGGAVNSKNLIAYKGTDDDFDTDNGYSGLNQFGIAVRDTAYFDATYNATSGSSTSEGFESDNEALGTANVKPITSAVFSNYTMVGPVPVGATYSQMNSRTRAAFRRGARIRRNSALRIVNSIFMGYRNFLMIDGDSTVRNTNFPAALALVNPKTPVDQKTHQTFFTNNLIVNTAAAQSPADSTSNSLLEVARARGSAAKLAALNDWARQSGPLANNINPVAFTTGTLLINPLASSTTPDFKPVSGSPALSGANFTDNPILSALVTSLREISRALAAAHPVYPNPVSGNSTLNFGRIVPAYGIFDLNGRLISYGVEVDHADLKNLARGIYIIKFNDNAQRFVVE
jgi:hypothetical protein